ncbi:hypothetical protein P8452_43188 [Trifolium repens]|nr:hypothetical protein P8452_43184 [Trifolium repens]WJX57654.1 hypothetical protein P8452_43188 [Trifolium repens]
MSVYKYPNKATKRSNAHTNRMEDEQDLFDNLPPSLVLLESVLLKTESVVSKILNAFLFTGFSYSMVLITKEVDSEYMRFMGMVAKGLLTGGYNKNPNPESIHSVSRTHESEKLNGYLQQEQRPKLSPRRLASLTYLGTPDLKGLKDIVETLPSGLDSSPANSIMPTNKPEQKKTLWLSGALISRRVIEV